MTGRHPDGVWTSPGRVNLIGEHTDYNDGRVLPMAIDRSAVVAVGLRQDSRVRCASLQWPAEVSVALEGIAPGRVEGWAAYPLGVLWAMGRAGRTAPGIDVVIDSDIAMGAGLGSSAAVEVATALAAAELSGWPMSQDDLARCCRDGEAAIAGAPTGLMDPLAVLAGRAGHAVLIDCATLERELVPFAPGEASATLLVIDTRVAHATAGAQYRARREECRRAATRLGVDSLREVTLDDVDGRLTGVLQRRARHVVTENARVARVADLLRAGRVRDIGALLDESHASLRHDYEVSCPELDCAVEAARHAGAWGARLTGAGFGGCAIALGPSDAGDAIADGVRLAFARQGHRMPEVFAVTSADGARRCA